MMNNTWPRRSIIPTPSYVDGVDQPIRSLHGVWDFSLDQKLWQSVQVPGDLEAQAMHVVAPQDLESGDFNDQDWASGDGPYWYKTTLSIPTEFEGCKILLCLANTVCLAKVYIDRSYIMEHHGGKTQWQCDLTDAVTAGNIYELTVELSFPEGTEEVEMNGERGMVGDAYLMAVPHDYVKRLVYRTDCRALFVTAEVEFTQDAMLVYRLMDAEGQEITLEDNKRSVADVGGQEVTFAVEDVHLWDSEHPYLYTLEVELIIGDACIQRFTRRVGFREIEVIGNQVYVNGDEVKLRGVNFLAVYALSGYCIPRDVERRYLETLRAGNVNYIRTAHFPRSQHFYDVCDEIGLYVECEHSVAWRDVRQSGDTSRIDQWMNPLSEMVEQNRNHPSVIIWSLGNESDWGENFKTMYDYLHVEEPTRPIKVSWGDDYVDIFSKHYPSSKVDFGGKDKPVIYDEYCHLYDHQGHNTAKMKFDPGYRAYFDVQLSAYWDKICDTEGALGGAIWNGFDHQCEAKHRLLGNGGRWGILDAWGRPKPEYWCTKDVYAPIQMVDSWQQAVPEKRLKLTFQNRYNHTCMTELKLKWQVNDQQGVITDLDAKPFEKFTVEIPYEEYMDGDSVMLDFCYHNDMAVRSFYIEIGSHRKAFDANDETMTMEETEEQVRFTSGAISIAMDKATGLIQGGVFEGKTMSVSGPYLNLGDVTLDAWQCKSMACAMVDGKAQITTKGSYGDKGCDFTLTMDAQGGITTAYQLHFVPEEQQEVGVTYHMPEDMVWLNWEREGRYANQEVTHIGRQRGRAYRHDDIKRQYGEVPRYGLETEETDFFYYGKTDHGGRGTLDFRSGKMNVRYASLTNDEAMGIQVIGDDLLVRCKVLKDQSVAFTVNNLWEVPQPAPWSEEYPGNDVYKTIAITEDYTNRVTIKLGRAPKYND